jgi:hypothetical protein
LSRVEDPEKSPVRAADANQPPTPFDSLIESIGQETRSRESRPQESRAQSPTQESSAHEAAAHEASVHELLQSTRDALAQESEPSNTLFGVGIRTAVAVGVSAVIALLLVILIPTFRRPDTASSLPASSVPASSVPASSLPASSFSADVQQFKAALPPRSQDQPSQNRLPSEDAATPVIEQFQRVLASPSEPAAQAGREPSDKLLRGFMQWRQKTGPAENAR